MRAIRHPWSRFLPREDIGSSKVPILTVVMESTIEDGTISFAELGLVPELLAAVRDAGYAHPTPIQRDAIPLALKGRDLIGLAQTGTGKTAAFTLPILQRLLGGPRRTRVLVLTPTRELAAQVEESFLKYGRHTQIAITAVYGGVPIDPQERALRRGVDVVVATPGRLHRSSRAAERRTSTSWRCSCWTRRIACSTWGSRRRSIASSPKCPRTGRPCSSARRCRPKSRRWHASICGSR